MELPLTALVLSNKNNGCQFKNHLIFTILFIQTGDTDEGPELKKKHQEDETLDSKKPELPAHNSIADTLLCSICQV